MGGSGEKTKGENRVRFPPFLPPITDYYRHYRLLPPITAYYRPIPPNTAYYRPSHAS